MSAIYTHTVPGYLLKPQHPVTINLIGCGGTGSQLLTHLARIDHTLRAGGLGFGSHPGLHVRAFDGDTVTDSNIGRQNFAPSDVGQNKAVVLITRINRFYGQNWEAHPYCCTSMYWAEVFPNEEGKKKGVESGTLCYKCKKVKRNNLHRITLEEYRTVFNRPNITHREFNNLYSHD